MEKAETCYMHMCSVVCVCPLCVMCAQLHACVLSCVCVRCVLCVLSCVCVWLLCVMCAQLCVCVRCVLCVLSCMCACSVVRVCSLCVMCAQLHACVLSCVCAQTLCSPLDCSLPGSSVHGMFQAKILELVAISSSRGSSWSRDRTCISYISCIGRQILYHWTIWEAEICY